jgi:hypothetical protein
MTKYRITETNGRFIITNDRGAKLGDFGCRDAAKAAVKRYEAADKRRSLARDYAWLGI